MLWYSVQVSKEASQKVSGAEWGNISKTINAKLDKLDVSAVRTTSSGCRVKYIKLATTGYDPELQANERNTEAEGSNPPVPANQTLEMHLIIQS